MWQITKYYTVTLFILICCQARDSVKAIMEGQGFDETQPYVDVILEEPVLNKSGIPVVADLLSVAISDGKINYIN